MSRSSFGRLALWLASGLAFPTAVVFGAEMAAGPLALDKLKPDLLKLGCYNQADPSLASVNWQSQIHIRSDADVETLRSRLIEQIWPEGFPTGFESLIASPATVDAKDPNASGLYRFLSKDAAAALKSERRLTIDMGKGLRSVVFLWEPQRSNGRLFIVHDGHSNNSYRSDGSVQGPAIAKAPNFATVKSLLSRGFAVMWLQMPLFGDNLDVSTPEAPFPGSCRLSCDRHAAIFQAYGAADRPLHFFLEPIAVALNFTLASSRYSDVSIMGASGGGWAALVAAAIDPRITNSVAVAGSLPMRARQGRCAQPSIGDAEQQSHAGLLYGDIDYLDLYVMAANGVDSNGNARRHLQVNNQYDTCCFFGRQQLDYAGFLTRYVSERRLGNYRHKLDDTFVGHGYDVASGENGKNVTLDNVVLPMLSGTQ